RPKGAIPVLSTADAKSPRAARGSEKPLVLEPASRMVAVEPVLLTPGVHLIGSGADCTTVVSAQGVQEKHCEITVSDRRATLKAFDRRTWLNAGPVVESSL